MVCRSFLSLVRVLSGLFRVVIGFDVGPDN